MAAIAGVACPEAAVERGSGRPWRSELADLSTPQHARRPTIDVQRYRAIRVVDDQREPELLTSSRDAQSARQCRPLGSGLHETELDAIQLRAATGNAELPSSEVETQRRTRIRGFDAELAR